MRVVDSPDRTMALARVADHGGEGVLMGGRHQHGGSVSVHFTASSSDLELLLGVLFYEMKALLFVTGQHLLCLCHVFYMSPFLPT